MSYPKLSAWHFIVYANPVIYATPQIRFEVNFKWIKKKVSTLYMQFYDFFNWETKIHLCLIK